MRHKIALTSTVAAISIVAGCAQDDSSGDAQTVSGLVGEGSGQDCVIDDPVQVGVVLSLTEGAAFAGEYQKEGLELGFEELNKKGGVEYKLTIEDDKTDLEQSIAAYEKLIDREKVNIIVGPTLSDMAFSTFEDAQKAGVPALGISTTAEGIPEIGDYIFRDSLPEEVALAESLPAANEALGLEKVAVMHDNQDEFTSSAYDTMSAVLKDEGIDVVADETFATTDTEFRSQLTKVKSAQPDALVLSALPAATIPLVQQARELGIKVPIVGGNAFNSPVLIGSLKDAAEGLIVGGAWSSALETAGNAEFVHAYSDAYGREPDQFAAQAYTAAKLIDEAVRADCDGNREAIKNNLGELSDVETVLGPISLDKDGEVHQEPVVQIVKNGKLTLLEN